MELRLRTLSDLSKRSPNATNEPDFFNAPKVLVRNCPRWFKQRGKSRKCAIFPNGDSSPHCRVYIRIE